MRRALGTAAAAVLCLGSGLTTYAQTAANVAVVINEASPASVQVGEYYAKKRGLPESNVIRIRTPTDEVIGRLAYAQSIERAIALALGTRGLQDRILYLVLTKGVPLRISGRPGLNGTTASVDAELTLLYRRMSGREASTVGRIDNPFYLGDRPIRDAKPFSHRDHDIYLVTRLDGFTVQDALGLIDRAEAPSSGGRILLDRRSDPGSATGDLWLVETAAKLKELGQGDRVDLVETAAVSGSDQVAGYYSWGSNDPGNRRRRLGLPFVAGSIGATLAGTDARTFMPPPDGWEPGPATRDRRLLFADSPQSLTGDLIRDGITGVAGNVSEPLLASSIRPQILFPAYFAGANLAEAFYLAMPHLSWQSVVIGDPLCRPYPGPGSTQPLTEEPVDEQTGLPGLFSKRRLAVVRAAYPSAPANVIPLIVKAEEDQFQGRNDAAQALLEEATKLAPDLTAHHLRLGLLYENSKQLDKAIERYRRVIELDPQNSVALNNLAFRLSERPEGMDEALVMSRKAAALAPANPNVLDTLGWIHYRAGNHAEAAKYVLEAVRLDPYAPEIRLHAAVVSFAVGSYKAAQAHLDAAVKLEPAFESRDDVRELRANLKKKG